MKKRSTIRAKVLWIAFAINALCTTSYSIYSYSFQKSAFLTAIDNKLISAANALQMILPEEYHDKIINEKSVSAEQYEQIKRVLTVYARNIKIVWLYSYMKIGDTLKTTATNMVPALLNNSSQKACEKSLKKVQRDPKENFFCSLFHKTCLATEDIDVCDKKNYLFFREEEYTPGIRKALDTMTVQYEEYCSAWGNFRSVFIPMKTKDDRQYVLAADMRSDFIQTHLCRTLLHCAGIGIAIFVVVWIFSYLVVSRILQPVSRLTSYTRELAEGGFRLSEAQKKQLRLLADQYKDEVGELAQGISYMSGKLLEYIADLKETTAAKERIESELSIAHDIQMSFLPKVFPDRSEFELYATLVPAKEVGGDLFDFMMLDNDHLFFYVGDVSDKGVPAALFMAVTMTLMKRTANHKGIDPAEILRIVNNDLSDGNENVLFVTMVCAILDVNTGELCYSNAGHNPPLILRKAGEVERLTLPEGIVLGIAPDADYKTLKAKLGSGDSIVMYTDGVNEAMNMERKMYSEKRLFELAKGLTDKSPKEQSDLIMKSVKEHAGEAPASDDITILSLKYL
jgi:phosphoserine phosphatase RsbU/P